MASSNSHWPRLFRSKPCHHQWQHQDFNPSSLFSPGFQKPCYPSALGSEERTPEPKPRWNPKPEQIRILEAIFNSGMTNPPRDEIRRITAQLQEYGNVGDANVFYWFQNRKSRSKHKQRLNHLKARSSALRQPTATTSSSSSSSNNYERSMGSDKIQPLVPSAATSGGRTGAVNQTYFSAPVEICGEPFFDLLDSSQEYCIAATGEQPGIFGAAEEGIGLSSGFWNDIIMEQDGGKSGLEEAKNIKQAHPCSVITSPIPVVVATSVPPDVCGGATSVASAINEINGLMGESGGSGGGGNGTPAAARSSVFMNDVTSETAAGPFNTREVFGEETLFLHSSNPVLVDEWGITLQPLQHGASYYLI